MPAAFEDNFWGEKFTGFDILQQNFKLGANGCKEFGEFIKERSGAEEVFSKALLKLANKTTAHGHIGSFEPCWKFVQSSTEKLANIHVCVIQNLQDVSKMLKEYGDAHKDKQKQLKDEFVAMSEAAQNVQTLSTAVQKAKEIYQQKSTEVDKCRKESTTIKEIEKSEAKLKKSCDDYKGAIDKREAGRKEYETKMRFITKKFQQLEKQHLTSLLKIVRKYEESLTTERYHLDTIIDEFRQNMNAFTVDTLLEQFVSSKRTGSSVPASIEFEAIELTSPPVEAEEIASRQVEKKKIKSTKRDKKKTKRKEKTNGTVQTSDVASTGSNVPEIEVEVDEEGYRIPPPDAESLRSAVSKTSASSDSDSDSDDDDEPRKFKVTIKPKESQANSPSMSLDELRTLSANLTLSSPSAISKRHNSVQDEAFFSSSNLTKTSGNLSKSSNALFDLGSNSNESSPTPPARSRRLFPTSASMDALGDAASKPSSTSEESGKKVVTFGDLFGDSVPDAKKNNDSKNETPDPVKVADDNKPSKSVDVSPPPLPVKRRSMSGTSQSSLGSLIETNTAKEPSPAVAPSQARDLPAPTPAQRPSKTTSASSMIPTLAPPVQPSTSRRQAASKKDRPLPQPPSRKASQTDPFLDKSSSDVQISQSSFLADLADINFTSGPSTDFFPSSALEDSPSSNSSLRWDNGSHGTSSAVVTTPLPLPRGNIQAQRSDSTLVPSATIAEKVTPIAVAFIETVNAHFKGSELSKCDIRITGDMAISFPASIIPVLTADSTTHPVLTFDIVGTNALEQILPNNALVERCSQTAGGDTMTFKFNMAALSTYLKKQSEQGRSASYYNIDIIKYHVRSNGHSSTPLQLGAFWKCDCAVTDLKIDFKYNGGALPSNVPLSAVSVVVPVNGGVTAMQSKPTATWSAEHMRALWKMPSLSLETGNSGVGSLRARFDVTDGPTSPAVIAVQFSGEGSTVSNLKFELTCASYKLSLVKRRFITGKYLVEP